MKFTQTALLTVLLAPTGYAFVPHVVPQGRTFLTNGGQTWCNEDSSIRLFGNDPSQQRQLTFLRQAAASETPTKVTTGMIKELREATGAGMMDCKKALMETDGDVQMALENLRKAGLAKADKKASRVAAEGKIIAATSGSNAVIVEINCETDFVAKDAGFLEYAQKVADTAAANGSESVEALMATEVDGETLEATRQALVSKIGENIQVRRIASSSGAEGTTTGSYVHMGNIGVIVELEGGDEALAQDVAMHVAAMNPDYATKDDVPAEDIEKERAILTAQVADSGKPPEIIEKMVEGRIRKYLEEICLVSQTFVKTNDKTVGELLKQNGATMKGFKRIVVGEGIEKKVDDFAAEVASMAAPKAAKTEEPAPAAEVKEEPAAVAEAPAAAPAKAKVTTAMIKELREATGAGMMDCKKALTETEGDVQLALENLRKAGLAKADKKASRVAAEGKIIAASSGNNAVVVEINCETDFVAKDAGFLEYAQKVADAAAAANGNESVEALMATEVDGETLEATRQALVSKIGENIQVRRISASGGEGITTGSYVHMGNIGVLVELEGGDEELAQDVAMHVAAMNPDYATQDDVPAEDIEKERAILTAQVADSGKPPEIIEKMVEGRIRKYLEEICLVSQTFVKTNDKTVGELLKQKGAKMKGFKRIVVGEGIEKKVDDFAAEVASMAAPKPKAEEAPAPEPVAEEPAAVVETPPKEEAKPAAKVTTAMIKELREATGAGMMDCKKALTETNGDVDLALENLRKAGLAKADKKASRVAAEGKIIAAQSGNNAVIVEINCETDFVAKDAGFLEYAQKVADAAAASGTSSVEALMAQEVDGETLEATRQALVSKIGENIQVRRVAASGGEGITTGSYVHMGNIGVLVELEGGDSELATDVAMHVAAMNPEYATKDDVPAENIEKERSILMAQVAESGKPPEIMEKMVEGRIRKYLEEICLVSQTFVKTNDKTVGELLKQKGAKMKGFQRIVVGEGIEKKVDDFAAEVAAMAGGSK